MAADVLLARLEGVRKRGRDSRWLAKCPAHQDRSASLSVFEESDGRVLMKCFAGCNTHDVLEAIGLGWSDLFGDRQNTRPSAPHKPMAPRAPEKEARHLAPYAVALWDACVELRGSVGEHYLRARGCALPPRDSDLRFHQALHHHQSGYCGPALVALVTCAVTNARMTLHRTWILPDGRKAPVNPARMLLGGHSKACGVVRLWPDDAVTSGLAIAEGIETALTMAHAFVPVWAAIDAGNLAALSHLAGIEALTIAVDHDPAGITAAQQCADRWTRAGVEVRLAMPPDAGHDLNDLVTAQ